jgi:hypothetical protein
MYSAVGNSIWFATNKGRCFKSTDRGQNWSVSQVVTVSGGEFNVCFSSEQKGCFVGMGENYGDVAITYDGGVSWDTASIPPGYMILGMSSVGGFDGGFVMTGWKNFTDVFFTPDMFTNIIKIASSLISMGSVSFLDASTGWLGGGESGFNEIFKYNDVLTSANATIKEKEKLTVFPNPSDNFQPYSNPNPWYFKFQTWREMLSIK